MDIFVARQPILTANEEVYGYELLYRNSKDNVFVEIDGDAATTNLLQNSFLGIGDERLSKGKKLFINFTRKLLLNKVPCLFPPEKIVIEVLEDIIGDEEMINVIKEYKEMGYTIALDDFLLKDINKSLIPYADIIKVDFLLSNPIQRNIIQRVAKKYSIVLLAEKIETREDFQMAIASGYRLFQGYFFSKPVIISTKDIPFLNLEFFNVLNELNNPEPDLDKVSQLIERDLSLSYKILKIVNTMAYYTKVKITSIKQAILILGLNELIRWLTVISLNEQTAANSNKDEAVIIQSFVRAKLAEQLGEKLFGKSKRAECFILGLFSLLDTILHRPMENILDALPLSLAVKNALLNLESDYTIIMNIIEALELANWQELNQYQTTVSPSDLNQYYVTSIKWANEIISNLESVQENEKSPQ